MLPHHFHSPGHVTACWACPSRLENKVFRLSPIFNLNEAGRHLLPWLVNKRRMPNQQRKKERRYLLFPLGVKSARNITYVCFAAWREQAVQRVPSRRIITLHRSASLKRLLHSLWVLVYNHTLKSVLPGFRKSDQPGITQLPHLYQRSCKLPSFFS